VDRFAKLTTLFSSDHGRIGPPTVQRAGDVLMRVGDYNQGNLPIYSNEDSVVEIGMKASPLREG
jgi:hypothetical protein